MRLAPLHPIFLLQTGMDWRAAMFDALKFARSAFGTRNDLTRVAAVKELFDRGYGRAVQPLSGPTGGAIPIDDGGSQSLAMIARKVALAFRLAALGEKAAGSNRGPAD
jgi:hypothetical protein